MFSTIFLCGVASLLCLGVVKLAAYTHRLFKINRSRRLDLRRFFLAIGFLPMAIVTISNIGASNPALVNFLAFLRNPVLGIDVTIGAFAQLGEISFLMNFITAILLSSTVVITLSGKFALSEFGEQGSGRDSGGNHGVVAHFFQNRVVDRPYLCYGCYLS